MDTLYTIIITILVVVFIYMLIGIVIGVIQFRKDKKKIVVKESTIIGEGPCQMLRL